MEQLTKVTQLAHIMESVFQKVEKEKDITLGELMQDLKEQLKQVVNGK